MFKVGDVINVINGRRGDRYRVISIEDKIVLRNIHQTNPRMNFTIDNFDGMKLDEVYYRKEKIEKIMDTIDSINILRHAKQTAELNRKINWMYMMEMRKQKIQSICSKLEIK